MSTRWRALGLACLLAACGDTRPGESVRFSILGDFGSGDSNQLDVANLIHRFAPDFILTVGDNNYFLDRAGENIDDSYARIVGAYYGGYISRDSSQGPNRFWPTLGNHDWYGPVQEKAYLDFFTALPREPAQGRYYQVEVGPVHLFAIDSDGREPDGHLADSVQAMWLKEQLAASTSCYDIVFFHHPPYSSGRVNEYFQPELRWPFAEWGADVVAAGHEHFYERLEIDGIPYLISGSGGSNLFDFLTDPAPPESRARFNRGFGAIFVTIERGVVHYEFQTTDGRVIDPVDIPSKC